MSLLASALATAYFSAALLCLTLAYLRVPGANDAPGVSAQRAPDQARRVNLLWTGCGLVLTFLGVLALWQLELMLGDMLRQASRSGGWYALRRPFQALALLVGLWLAWKVLRQAMPLGARAPVLGCVAGTLLLAFVVWGRFVSWHWMDSVLNFRWAGVSTGRWLEMTGLLVVAAFAAWQWRGDRHDGASSGAPDSAASNLARPSI